MQAGRALLVDVRSTEERHFIGQVPGSVHVARASGTALTRKLRFVKEPDAKVGGKDLTVLPVCRMGKRSALPAAAVAKFGSTALFVRLEGFEGDHDDAKQRGQVDDRRFHGLPWAQD